jgi:hypothetical protein
MEAFGAEVIVEPAKDQGITPELIQRMKSKASQKVEEVNGFYVDQFGSVDVVTGYHPMRLEIAEQI